MLAPAEGLFLNQIKFDGYNMKPGIPELLILDEDEVKRTEDFRPTIEKQVIKCEVED